jgi:DNA-binding response OmpR family regulator
MIQQRYDRARMVVGETEGQGGFVLKTALGRIGARDIRVCRSVAAVDDALDDGLVDLLLFDCDQGHEDIPEMIRRIRRRARGRNPFVIVVVTLREPDAATVRRLIDAGIDDLIRAPVNVERVGQSIVKHTHARKPFVASARYVGPTRRSAERDNQNPALLIHVPNTLRAKVVHGLGDSELQRVVDRAVFDLEDRHLEARGQESDRLARQLLVPVSAVSRQGADRNALLERLDEAARAVLPLTDHPAAKQVASLIRLLLSLVERISGKSPDDARTESQLLAKLAMAISRALTVERDSVDLMQEIVDALVDRGGAR